ncbi:hypothetical protein [Acinetobacter junii]|uniref:hypothetical protein n=1 Tax=Acinetobacter junii TaxID=40215 RepID=UPI00125070A1|nr:hypothetical protein [Acinetobacter junii]
MKNRNEFSREDIKYFPNDRLYVDVNRDGKSAISFFAMSSLFCRVTKWESARVVESNARYVRAITDSGKIVVVPKTAAKPVLRVNYILFLERHIEHTGNDNHITFRDFIAIGAGLLSMAFGYYFDLLGWY